jgi:hypothetical protein
MTKFNFVTLANWGMRHLTRNLVRTIRSTGMSNTVFIACTDKKIEAEVKRWQKDQVALLQSEAVESITAAYAEYGSLAFQRMMMRKYPAIKRVLEQTGKDAIFVDGDIGFWKDINKYFDQSALSQGDILCALEPDDIGFCCGFTYFTHREKTFRFIDHVIAEQKKILGQSGEFIGEQAVFNSIVTENSKTCPAKVIGLPEKEFCNGHYLKTPGCWTADGDVRKGIVGSEMYLAHANWMKGIARKRRFLKRLGLYKSEKWQRIEITKIWRSKD